MVYGTKMGTHQDSHVVEYHTKFYKLNRLDEINTRYYNTRQNKMAFFHSMETVETFSNAEEVGEG